MITIIFLIITIIFPQTIFAYKDNNLFIIERSKNSNIVRYDVNLLDNGKIDPKNPVVGYWILNEIDGSKKDLSLYDKKAYGFTVKKDLDGVSYIMTINSFKDIKIKILQLKDIPKAMVDINGKTIYLEKIYVSLEEDKILPKVRYIELVGENIKTGIKEHEYIIPG